MGKNHRIDTIDVKTYLKPFNEFISENMNITNLFMIDDWDNRSLQSLFIPFAFGSGTTIIFG